MSERFKETSEIGMTVLLVGMVFTIFIVYPFFELEDRGRLLIDITLSLSFIAGAVSLADRNLWRNLVAGLALFTVFTRFLANFNDLPLVDLVCTTTIIAFLLVASTGILIKILRPGRITRQRLEGAVAVYLMIALTFAFLYHWIELNDPGSFLALGEGPMMGDLVYFSFVTLTTVGYGDILPLSPQARSLAMMEALIGQFYIGILIARLVSLQIASSGSDS